MLSSEQRTNPYRWGAGSQIPGAFLMTALTDAERDALRVEKLIFHAVHHGGDEPTLFDEIAMAEPKHEEFFRGHVIGTLKGNRFEFAPGSPTLEVLRGVEDDPESFVDASKRLARDFHRLDGRFKRGVLIVTSLVTGPRRLHSLIKLDYEDGMLTFAEHNAKASITDVLKPLSRSPKAIQKSALIELDGAGGNLVVIDHSQRSGITEFFQGFLGVRRKLAAPEMTKAVTRTLIRTVQNHIGELPPEITARVKPRLVEIAAKQPDFDPDRFFGDFFGAHGLPEVRGSYDRELARNGLDGEAFTFDAPSLPADGPRRFRTKEGITIHVPEGARDTFAIDPQPDGSILVTIRSTEVGER